MQHKSTTIFLQSCHFAITCEFMGETAISRETPATVNKRNHSISSSVVKEKHLVPKISQFCVFCFFFCKKGTRGIVSLVTRYDKSTATASSHMQSSSNPFTN